MSLRSKKVLDLEELGCRLTTTSHQDLDCSRIALMRYDTFEKIPISYYFNMRVCKKIAKTKRNIALKSLPRGKGRCGKLKVFVG